MVPSRPQCDVVVYVVPPCSACFLGRGRALTRFNIICRSDCVALPIAADEESESEYDEKNQKPSKHNRRYHKRYG